MAAPLAALPIAREAGKAISQDLVVIAGKVYRQVKAPLLKDGKPVLTKSGRQRMTRVLEPIDLELHVNPIGIGVGILATGIASLGAWVAWNGLSLPIPFGSGSITLLGGIKDSPQGDWLRDKWRGGVGVKRDDLQGNVDALTTTGALPLPGETDCQRLQRAYDYALSQAGSLDLAGLVEDARHERRRANAILVQALNLTCEWAQ